MSALREVTALFSGIISGILCWAVVGVSIWAVELCIYGFIIVPNDLPPFRVSHDDLAGIQYLIIEFFVWSAIMLAALPVCYLTGEWVWNKARCYLAP